MGAKIGQWLRCPSNDNIGITKLLNVLVVLESDWLESSMSHEQPLRSISEDLVKALNQCLQIISGSS